VHFASSDTRRVLARNLARALTSSGRPRLHVAELAGCSPDVFFDVLAGRVAIGLERLDRIAAVVNWPTWALLDATDVVLPQARSAPDVPSVVALASRTRALLVVRDWSVPTLVERSDLRQAQLHMILAGRPGTSIDAVARLAVAFDVVPKAMLIPLVDDDAVA
jgi:hypothetical protein